MSRRITILDGRTAGSEGKVIALPDQLTLAEFFDLCGKKLLFHPNKAFLSDGGELDDPQLIRDADQVILTADNQTTEPGHARKKGGSSHRGSANGPNLLQQKRGSLIAGDDEAKSISEAASTKVKSFSVAVLGAGGSGKSALTIRFVQGKFVRQYDPTIEDAFRKNFQVGDSVIQMNILDTAGQEDYLALRSSWIREKDGILLVFSLVDKSSYQSLDTFYEQIESCYEDNPDEFPPVLLVGNKVDLCDGSNPSGEKAERRISVMEGEKRSKSSGAGPHCGYLETSAATGKNVEKAFETLVHLIDKRKEDKRKRGDSPPETKKKKWFCNLL
jgi:GTPase KRas